MNIIYYRRQSLRRKKVMMLKTIKKNPRKVTLEDIETGEIKTFPSIYKAAKFIDQAPQTVTYWGNRKGACNNRYKVVTL